MEITSTEGEEGEEKKEKKEEKESKKGGIKKKKQFKLKFK